MRRCLLKTPAVSTASAEPTKNGRKGQNEDLIHGTEPAVGQRLTAAGLIERIFRLMTETFEQFQRGDRHLRLEGIDVAGNEQPDAHGDQPFSARALPQPTIKVAPTSMATPSQTIPRVWREERAHSLSPKPHRVEKMMMLAICSVQLEN